MSVSASRVCQVEPGVVMISRARAAETQPCPGQFAGRVVESEGGGDRHDDPDPARWVCPDRPEPRQSVGNTIGIDRLSSGRVTIRGVGIGGNSMIIGRVEEVWLAVPARQAD